MKRKPRQFSLQESQQSSAQTKKSLNISFIADYQTWVKKFNKDNDIYVLHPPLGFFDSKSVNSSILLTDSFDYNDHWFEVYARARAY